MTNISSFKNKETDTKIPRGCMKILFLSNNHIDPVFKIESLIWVHIEGLSNFSPSADGLVQIQDVDPSI